MNLKVWLKRSVQLSPGQKPPPKTFVGDLYIVETRLGLQCQTPALSKVYFTWVGTIILGLKNF